jgi:hypothetical protein
MSPHNFAWSHSEAGLFLGQDDAGSFNSLPFSARLRPATSSFEPLSDDQLMNRTHGLRSDSISFPKQFGLYRQGYLEDY